MTQKKLPSEHSVSWREMCKRACPSLLTMCALCLGITSVRTAFQGEFSTCVVLMFLSAVCDGLDGHVARYLGAVTAFGGELDSLCDLVDFGAGPALIMYAWAIHPLSEGNAKMWSVLELLEQNTSKAVQQEIVWLSCCIYVVACAYRLARFNVGTLRDPHPLTIRNFSASRPDASIATHKPSGFRTFYIARSKFFSGIPAPVGAYLSISPIVLHFSAPLTRQYVPPAWFIVTIVQLGVSALMVSRVPTLSAKVLMRDPQTESHLRNRSNATMAAKGAALAGFVAVILSRPWQVLLFMEILAISSIPLGPIIYHFVAHDA